MGIWGYGDLLVQSDVIDSESFFFGLQRFCSFTIAVFDCIAAVDLCAESAEAL